MATPCNPSTIDCSETDRSSFVSTEDSNTGTVRPRFPSVITDLRSAHPTCDRTNIGESCSHPYFSDEDFGQHPSYNPPPYGHFAVNPHDSFNSYFLTTTFPLQGPPVLDHLMYDPAPVGPVGFPQPFLVHYGHEPYYQFEDPEKAFLDELESIVEEYIKRSESEERMFEWFSKKIFELVKQKGHSTMLKAVLDRDRASFSDEQRSACLFALIARLTELVYVSDSKILVDFLFQESSETQIHLIAEQLKGSVLKLSLDACGCFAIQNALHACSPADREAICRELHGHVSKCTEDLNGNHVIQCVVSTCPEHVCRFVVDELRGQVVARSTHVFGCRIMQRIIERCQNIDHMMHELIKEAKHVSEDRYGNYVIQHVLKIANCNQEYKEQIFQLVLREMKSLATHKYASNVVELALSEGTDCHKSRIVRAILEQQPDGSYPQLDCNHLIPQLVNHRVNKVDRKGEAQIEDGLNNADLPLWLRLVRDRYGNYVIQKVLLDVGQQEVAPILEILKRNVEVLLHVNYGKHVKKLIDAYTDSGARPGIIDVRAQKSYYDLKKKSSGRFDHRHFNERPHCTENFSRKVAGKYRNGHSHPSFDKSPGSNPRKLT